MNNMPEQSPATGDTDKIAALRRTKRIATSALALCVAVFAGAKLFEQQYPFLGYVAAFAEAATIGGLADWYAVVALFKRPLGLPIPHTAIIPENRERIANNLGRFIEVNFLAEEPVREKLREVDYASLVADWLSDPQRSAGLSRFVTRLVPKTLASVEQSGLRGFLTQRVLEQVDKIEIAPLAADFLTAFTQDGKHRRIFDELTHAIERFLKDETALEAMREKIRAELPSIFNLFKADAYLLKRIVNSAGDLLEQAREDENHPLRAEFDGFVQNFIEQLKHSPDYARRAERMKRELLARPQLRNLADDMWNSMRQFIEKDAQAEDSLLRAHLGGMFVEIGRHLAQDPAIRADMNQGFVVALSSFVESQKSGVSTFIADQVKRWDLTQMTRIIETNIGRDLQYIRFNGMLIGGLAGLGLYIFEQVFLTN